MSESPVPRCVLGILLALLAGCSRSRPSERDDVAPPSRELAERIDRSLSIARQYLVSRQSPDGAWRSGVYGFFKDGPSLTPHVISALCLVLPQEPPDPVVVKGAGYLVSLVDAQGKIPEQLDLIYPVYTASEASVVMVKAGKTPAALAAQHAWLEYLKSQQLVEALGWHPSDADYGGWGYALQPPHKKPPGAFHGSWDASNLTATVYAIAALRSAGVSRRDPIYSQALAFIEYCQNYTQAPTGARDALPKETSDLLDGGFFFSPTTAMRNKAGSSRDLSGQERFNSYGSMTCDGLLGLMACGLPLDHPRVAAARHWLAVNFSVEHNPGNFVVASEDLRDATYYYYVRSLSQALARAGERWIDTPRGRIDWAATLAIELMRRQQPDGSWVNAFTDAKEDDPLVATPFAAAALRVCRNVITDEGGSPARRAR